MKKWNFKILLPVVGMLLLVMSILALQDVMAGIGLGIAGLLIFGPDVTEKRGKTGGLIYSKNRSGHYTKGKVIPRNPNSNAQSVNRQLHRELMKAWKHTEVNHKLYNLYALNHPVQGKMGNTICLSGINWFVRINRMARKANPECGLILSPPKDDTVFPQVKEVIVTANASTQSVVVQPISFGNYLEGMKVEVIATRQMSYGVFCPFGFRSIGVYDPNSEEPRAKSQGPRAKSQETTISGIDVTAEYVAKYGQLIAGEKIFVKVRFVMPTGEATGFWGGNGVIQSGITN